MAAVWARKMLGGLRPEVAAAGMLTVAGSGNLMLCTLLVAPVAIILGATVLGEALSTRAYTGFALLALGLIILDGRLIKPIQNRLRGT